MPEHRYVKVDVVHDDSSHRYVIPSDRRHEWWERAENKKQGSTDEESEWMIGDKDGQTYEDYGWSLIESLSELYTNKMHHGVAPE